MKLTSSFRATQLVSGRAGIRIQRLAPEPVPLAPSCGQRRASGPCHGLRALPLLQTEPEAPAGAAPQRALRSPAVRPGP